MHHTSPHYALMHKSARLLHFSPYSREYDLYVIFWLPCHMRVHMADLAGVAVASGSQSLPDTLAFAPSLALQQEG